MASYMGHLTYFSASEQISAQKPENVECFKVAFWGMFKNLTVSLRYCCHSLGLSYTWHHSIAFLSLNQVRGHPTL